MADYALRREVLESTAQVGITEAEFGQLRAARSVLVDGLAFEQTYEVLLGNYKAFELAAAGVALAQTIESSFSYQAAGETLTEANRLLANLLTSARMYIDHVMRIFQQPDFAPSFSEQAKMLMAKRYDATFEYRFMEAIRNHIQHRGLPVHMITYTTHGSRGWADYCELKASKQEIQRQGGFKASILDEMPDFVELRNASRIYLSELSAIHIELREIASYVIGEAREQVRGAIERFAQTAEPCLGLAACRVDGDVVESIPLFLDWDDVRATLANKNRYKIKL